MTRPPLPSALRLAAIATLCSACVTQSTVTRNTQELDVALQADRETAAACAPRELAFAEARIEFSRYESERGNALSAAAHLAEAKQLVAAVLRKSKGAGCEADRDGDSIADTIDRCPDLPEDLDGEDDQDGCPDFDRDHDGVADHQDRCPNMPEDRDGFEDDDGCPDPDNDRDGIMDSKDRCPSEAEDFDGYDDLDGCPDPDNDGDGVADARDRCPNQPGPQASGGCPDTYKHIVIRDKSIELRQKIFFRKGTAKLDPRSNGVLSEIAQALTASKQVKVRIEGHTDSDGPAARNQKLSQGRAAAVRKYLIGRGVAATRLSAVGRGEDSPIDDNDTPEGRATNRRVEFHIVK